LAAFWQLLAIILSVLGAFGILWLLLAILQHFFVANFGFL